MANYKFYLDDTEVSLNKLLEVLGVDLVSIPKRNVKEFEINPDRVKKDNLGNPKFPKSLGVSTKFTAFAKGKDYERYVDVRIAERVKKVESKAGFRNSYWPGQLFFHGRNKSANDELEFIWLYIHPDAEGSPFREKKARWRYRFIDTVQKANNRIQEINNRNRAEGLVVGDHALTITQLRQIAKGLNIAGVDAMEPEEVRAVLLDKAYENPVKFYQQCTDRTVIFNGMIQEAIDKEVLKIESSHGLRKWHLGEEEIAIIPATSDSSKIVRDAVAERAQELVPRIKDALAGKNSAKMLNDPALDGLFDEFDPEKIAAKQTETDTEANVETNKQNEDFILARKREKFPEYFDLLPLTAEQLKEQKVHHTKIAFLETNRAEIQALKEELEASNTLGGQAVLT